MDDMSASTITLNLIGLGIAGYLAYKFFVKEPQPPHAAGPTYAEAAVTRPKYTSNTVTSPRGRVIQESSRPVQKTLKISNSNDVYLTWSPIHNITRLIIIIISYDTVPNQLSFYCVHVTLTDTVMRIHIPVNNIKVLVYGVNRLDEIVISSVFWKSLPSMQVTLTPHCNADSIITILAQEQTSKKKNKKSPTLKCSVDQVIYDWTYTQEVRLTPNRSTQNLYNGVYITFMQTKHTISEQVFFKEYLDIRKISKETPFINFTLPSREMAVYKIFKANADGSLVAQSDATKFITHNRPEDVHDLLDMAHDFIRARTPRQTSSMTNVSYMYRNKPLNHPTIIESRQTGVIAKYLKDNNGDQASSINKRIKGLFFSATPNNKTGLPQTYSYFGNYRIKIPPQHLITGMNLYFADFYCNNEAHYVTLVLAKPGSFEDLYCSPRLVKLNIHDNWFLSFCSRTHQYQTTRVGLWVEVLYTEDIDKNKMLSQNKLIEEMIEDVRGRGHSTTNGFPKNTSCDICNLSKHPKVTEVPIYIPSQRPFSLYGVYD